MINCAIIDDEPLARECITGYIQQVDFLQTVGTGSSPLDLSRIREENRIELLFLDIEMPLMNGIEYLKMTSDPPMVILTTAYPSYALEGFQLDVLDYLVKPITFNRFFKAVTKAREYHQLLVDARRDTGIASDGEYFFVKCDSKYEKINFSEILFVEAMQNYVIIYTTKGKYITLLYLKTIEEKLDPRTFIRVHRSFVVSISKIDSIDNSEINIGSHRIPISRTQQSEIIDKVVHTRLLKK